MGVRLLGMCRGDGTAYVKLGVDHIREFSSIRVDSCCTDEGRPFPCLVYGAKGDSSKMGKNEPVLVFPLIEARFYKISLSVVEEGGTVAESSVLRLSTEALKWRSRFAYAFRRDLTSSIRDIDKPCAEDCLEVGVLQCVRKETETVVRFCVTVLNRIDCSLSFRILDGAARQIDGKVVVLRDEGETSQHGVEKRTVSASVSLPSEISSLCIWCHDESGCCQGGYLFLRPFELAEKIEEFETTIRCASFSPDYNDWFSRSKVSLAEINEQKRFQFNIRPLISIVVPLFNTPDRFLRDMLQSVLSQSYGRWQMVLVNASPEVSSIKKTVEEFIDNRIKYLELDKNEGIVANTNVGICASEGDFVSFLDHDDLLEPDTLFEYVRAINDHPECDVLYCDEDGLGDNGDYLSPHFKSDFNLDLLYSHNYITHFLMIRKSLLDEIGLSQDEVNGAQDYDLTLRAIEKARRIHHVPRVLYHWRQHEGSSNVNPSSKLYAQNAGRIALEKHFERRGIPVKVGYDETPFSYTLSYLNKNNPFISVVIPSKDNVELLKKCVVSLMEKAHYDSYEIVIVENNSEKTATFAYYEELVDTGRVRIVTYRGDFNYSKIINHGVEHANGDYFLLLNNDTRIITEGILLKLSGYSLRKEVGVVGAKLLYEDGLIQHGGVVLGPCDVPAHLFHCLPDESRGYCERAAKTQNLSAVTGACQFVSKEAFEAVGGYDEAYSVGYNDIDFCLRVQDAGYLIVYDPHIKLYHNEFSSRGRDVSIEKRIRGYKERAMLHLRWARYFVEGDPYYNPNLDRNSVYFGL